MTLRDDHWLAIAAFVLLLGIGSCLQGCGPSASTVRRQYEATTTRCVSDLHQLEADCPSGDACIAKLHELRARCDAELARICDNRSGRRVCP